jgi:hypothetical protein
VTRCSPASRELSWCPFVPAFHGSNKGAPYRLNGEDYEPGATALKTYVATWPEAGFEFRKQYVILQTIEATDE